MDPRKPVAVVTVRPRKAKNTKIELFSGADFAAERFSHKDGSEVSDTAKLYRLRVAGKWYPEKSRVLYSVDEVMEMAVDLLQTGCGPQRGNYND